MVVIKLDRVFDRDDVMVNALVDEVHHARERCTFSRSGRSRYQNQTTWPHTQLGENLRHTQNFWRKHLVGNLPQHHRDIATLLEN